MSMPYSGLIDKLREKAGVFRYGLWSGGYEVALLMDDAADAINTSRVMKYRLDIENAKLKELVHDMYGYYVTGTISECELCDLKGYCENNPDFGCKYSGGPHRRDADIYGEFEGRMRELGIEVE